MSDQGRDEEVRRPRRQTVIAAAVEAALKRLPRALPARVTKYEADKQRVSCKVLVMRPFFDEEDERQVESIPVIPGVPVIFPGGGGFRETYPISDGNLQINGAPVAATTGLLVWADRSLDKWLTGKGDEVDPEFDHVNSISDAFFLPGLNPFGAPLSSAPTDHMTVGADGGVQIHIHLTQVGVGADASDLASDAVVTKKDLQALYFAINSSGITPMDGGATLKAAILAALGAAGWSSGPPDGQLGSSVVTAKRV